MGKNKTNKIEIATRSTKEGNAFWCWIFCYLRYRAFSSPTNLSRLVNNFRNCRAKHSPNMAKTNPKNPKEECIFNTLYE